LISINNIKHTRIYIIVLEVANLNKKNFGQFLFHKLYYLLRVLFMNKNFLANIALLLTALIWGISFVAQKAGMDYVGPFTFNAVRSFLGGFSLIPALLILKNIKNSDNSCDSRKILLKGSLCCGFLLFFAMSIQQYSMLHATAGKAGFISSLYIIFVPLLLVLSGKKISKNTKYSIGLAIVGLYFLCFKSADFIFSFSDILLLISAIFYGAHIIAVNCFAKKINPITLSCFQFFVVGIFSTPIMFIFENPAITTIGDCKIPLFFAGILTCGVAYTLQIFGQKYTSATLASLILCLESVFAFIGSEVILEESMSIREIFGCCFIIGAVLFSQIKSKIKLQQFFRLKVVPIVGSDRLLYFYRHKHAHSRVQRL